MFSHLSVICHLQVEIHHHAIQCENLPLVLLTDNHSPDHLSNFLFRCQSFGLGEMDEEMDWIRVMDVGMILLLDAHVEGGVENNLPQCKHVQSGTEANCSRTMS